MRSISSCLVSAALLLASRSPAAPTPQSSEILDNPDFGPVPAESPYYSNYCGTSPPFPGIYTRPVFPTESGPPGSDDLLFQNLAGAEWAIYDFYQFSVNTFNESAFYKAGYPATTYQRIIEIRDNEAGHARIFEVAISNTSTKPAQCKYKFGITTHVAYLAAHTILEISSMAFLTGLILQPKLDSSKAALVVVAETEARHEAWGLIDIWRRSPFGGPVDTVFPYANEILDTTKLFIIPGSCPAGNPTYPIPSQALLSLSSAEKSTALLPGSPITLAFPNPAKQPKFMAKTTYYAVFFHGLLNVTEPFNLKTNASRIPREFEAKGLFLAVIPDTPGAPTIDSVKAGPLVIVEQPVQINSGVS